MSVQKDDISALRDDALLKFFIGNINKLSALLIKENKALDAAKFSEFNALLAEKKRLLDLLVSIETMVINDPSVVSGSSDKVKTEALSLYKKLNDLMTKTKINLEVNLRVSNVLIESLKHKAQNVRRQELGYDKAGKLASESKLAKDMPHVTVKNTV